MVCWMTGSLDRDRRKVPRTRPNARTSERRSKERLEKNDDAGMSLSSPVCGGVRRLGQEAPLCSDEASYQYPAGSRPRSTRHHAPPLVCGNCWRSTLARSRRSLEGLSSRGSGGNDGNTHEGVGLLERGRAGPADTRQGDELGRAERLLHYFQQLVWAGLVTVSHPPSTVFPTGPSFTGLSTGLQAVGAECDDLVTIDFARLLALESGGSVPPPGHA